MAQTKTMEEMLIIIASSKRKCWCNSNYKYGRNAKFNFSVKRLCTDIAQTRSRAKCYTTLIRVNLGADVAQTTSLTE